MQEQGRWEVISTGKVVPGKNPLEVREQLRSHFKLSDAALNRLLSGSPKTVRKALDKAKAQKYTKFLLEIGLDVVAREAPELISLEGADWSLEPLPQNGTSPPPSREAFFGIDQTRCPKCGLIQASGEECRGCGIVFSKYKPPENTVPDGKSPKVQTKSDTSAQQPPPYRLLAIFAGLALLLAVTFSHFSWESAEAIAHDEFLLAALHKPHEGFHKISKLVNEERFEELDSIVLTLHKRTMQDIAWEAVYELTVGDISDALKGKDEALLDRWVQATGSAVAYMVRGIYLTTESFNARGGEYAYATSDEQFKQQTALAKRALKDIRQALSLNHELLPAYSTLFRLNAARGIVINRKSELAKALKVQPATYHVRRTYMDYIVPKWGGSLPIMERFAEESMKDLWRNPRLWSLHGAVYSEEADLAREQRDFHKAIELYDKCLSFGVVRMPLKHRVYLKALVGEREAAKKDLDVLLSYYPNDGYGNEAREFLGD